MLSIALPGDADDKIVARGIAILNEVLDSQTIWVGCGQPRAFHYNSPYASPKWNEVQIPIKLIDEKISAANI